MTAFTVHEPPQAAGSPADAMERAERLMFVGDGFSWGAALLGPLWLAFNRHWQALAAWAGVAVVLAGVLHLVGAGPGWLGLALAGLGVVLGFEAADLERDWLAAAGWVEIGSTEGRDQADAERGFFDRWLAAGAPAASARSADAAAEALSSAGQSRTSARPGRA